MNKWLKVILITCLSAVLPVNNLSAQHVLEEIAEQLITNDEDNAYQWENLFEELSDLKENPLNINSATKEQLERFPFLNSRLIENILHYLYKYGSMVSINELMVVEDMDLATFRLLKPFITCQPLEEKAHTPTLKSILKYGKQELSARMDIPLYTRAGYQPFTSDFIEENPNKRYLGPSFYHNIRYKFRYTDKVYIGLTAEKDPGEPFFAGNNKKGYDYYSPYFYIRDFGKIRALALGNYRLNYGYGLVMNTDFNMGKTTALNTLLNRESGIKKHSSTDEYNYFQGIAGSVQLSEHLTADAFYSYRKMDGIVDDRFITSLKEDGYHRIPRDYEKKNSLTNQLMGSNIQYNGKNFELGLTGVYNFFNKVLNPTSRPYNKYYPRGRDFFNLGANYKFFFKKFTWMGEVAMDKDGRMATLNTLRYWPKANFQLIAMHRFYDVAYQSMYARSIGEGSMVQNESGFYLGMEADELAKVVTAIGNHDEGTGGAVNPIAAALILGDKTDVRRSRVSETDMNKFDVHDRVNYSVIRSDLLFNKSRTELTLSLEIDTEISSVMDYFEIFLERMVMCKQSCNHLGITFALTVNGQKIA